MKYLPNGVDLWSDFGRSLARWTCVLKGYATVGGTPERALLSGDPGVHGDVRRERGAVGRDR